MKVNFKETIKQKTDKELETISKDYAFYSGEERLIALNELESRNGLTKELLICKKNIEASIEMEPAITGEAIEAVESTKKIYTNRAIGVGTALGGPLVAGYFIAENFKAFGEVSKAKKTWIYTILTTIIILTIAFNIPDNVKIPNSIIPFCYAAIACFLVECFQKKNISAYIALGGKPFSWGRTILVSVIGLAITLALLFIVVVIFFADEI